MTVSGTPPRVSRMISAVDKSNLVFADLIWLMMTVAGTFAWVMSRIFLIGEDGGGQW
jgi:TRAP-type C4-dicarboxylate transport system permease large subunit